ncbi:hypothetical protein [Psychrobacillus sp. NPDC096389]|uniref:hypothetical protein n=1 Tax=Psychrobacillus sp. NPDC096389 TaxID=3364490 RepID=UPI0038213CA6
MKTKLLLLGLSIIVIIIAIVGVREFVWSTQVSEGDQATTNAIVEMFVEASESKLNDEEFGKWASDMNVMLSETMDNPKLKEANNDDGFEYYLKAQEVNRQFPKHLIIENKDLEKEHSNLILLSSYILHNQFTRTAHIDPNGEAKQSTEHADQWKPTDESMSSI